LRRVQSPEQTALFLGGIEQVNRALFSPDGQRVLTLSEKRVATIWDAATGESLVTISHDHAWRNGAWSPDGARVALCDNAFRIGVFNSRTGERPRDLWQSHNMVRFCFFSPDSKRLLTTSADNAAVVYDPETNQPLFAPCKHRAPIRTVAWSPDGRSLVSGSQDGMVRIWDAETGEPRSGILRHGGAITSLCFSTDSTQILTTAEDGSARLWRVAPADFSRHAFKHGYPIDVAEFSPNGDQLLTSGMGTEAMVWSLRGGESSQPMALPGTARIGSAMWLDHSSVLTRAVNGTFRQWVLQGEPRLVREIKVPLAVNGYFSPDGFGFIAILKDGSACLVDTGDGQTRWSLPAERTPRRFAFARGGTHLLEMRQRQLQWIRVSDGVADGAPVAMANASDYYFLSASGRRVVAIEGGSKAWVADTGTGQRVAGPMSHFNSIGDAAFSPDDSLVATVSEDMTLRIWDAINGEPMCPPMTHAARVLGVRFSRDGRFIATACADGFARIWELPMGPDDLEAEAQRLTGHRLDDAGNLRPVRVVTP